MKILVHLVHAAPAVLPLFEAAARARGLDVEFVPVLPAGAVASSAYAALADRWKASELTPAQGLLRDHRGPSAGRYDAWVLASWSAGYKLLERALAAADAGVITGAVLLDSGHAAFDGDHTAADVQLAPFVALGRRAMAAQALLHVGHTDVQTPQTGPGAFASTTQWAAEVQRLLGLPVRALSRGEAVERCLLKVQAFDEEPPARAKEEHVLALRGWGPGFLADALLAWTRAAITKKSPRSDLDEIKREVEGRRAIVMKSLGELALIAALNELEEGARENPPGSNGGPEIRMYLRGCQRAGRSVGITAGAWCAAFVGWCDSIALGELRVAGREDVPPVRWRAAVHELVADARGTNAWRPVGDGYRSAPGDLAIFRRAGGDPTRGGEGHVARVEVSPDPDGCFTTIGGNEGGRVARVERRLSDPDLCGFIAYPRAATTGQATTGGLARAAAAAGLDRAARETLDE